MGKWSNSKNGNLRYSVNRQKNSGIYIGPTKGLSSPRNSRRGCLCSNRDAYDIKCCKGSLSEQGVGNIQSPNSGSNGGTLLLNEITNLRSINGLFIGPTLGHSSPQTSEGGCLCIDTNTYDVSCCEGYLMNQGIGQTQTPWKEGGAFDSGYDEGFEIEEV